MKVTANGKVIGDLRNGVLTKKVKKSKHFFRMKQAWGVDKGVLDKFVIDEIAIVDTESGDTYTAPVSTWRERGDLADYGYGQQILLNVQFFEINRDKQGKLI